MNKPKAQQGSVVTHRFNSETAGFFARIRSFFNIDATDGEVLRRVLAEPEFWSEIGHSDFDQAFHLRKILQKQAVGAPLSRAEWLLLATLAHAAYLHTRRTYADPDLYKVLLQATLVLVHQLPDLGPKAGYCLGNMPQGQRHGKSEYSLESAINEEIGRVEQLDVMSVGTAEFGSRNFMVLLRDQYIENETKLSNGLYPFLPALCTLAARGYRYIHKKPAVAPVKDDSCRHSRAERFIDGDVELNLHVDDDHISGLLRLFTCEAGGAELGFGSEEFLDLRYAFNAPVRNHVTPDGDIYGWSQNDYGFERVLLGENGFRFCLSPQVVGQVQSVFHQMDENENCSKVISRLTQLFGQV